MAGRGRPMKFKTVEELQAKIDEYFESTPLPEQMITGLALALDTNRETLCSYGDKDIFSDAIRKAKARIEHAYELRGLEKGAAFDIFRLKNMGWRDKVETENKTSVEVRGVSPELLEMAKLK